jgi:nicotinamide phosphoribosyltransferase
MKLPNNIIQDTDAYKVTHHLAYPNNLTKFYSYGESRGGKYNKVVFFGLQMLIIDHLAGRVVRSQYQIDEAAHLHETQFGTCEYFNRTMWEHILNKYDGKLPITIKAVPEGTLVPTSNVLFTIESNDPLCVPLVNHIETLLMHVWYTSTVATNAFYIRKVLSGYLTATGCSLDGLSFMCNDFGFRGATGAEAAARGGAAFLTSFKVSDNLIADRAISFYYSNFGNLSSVFATEHSVATAYGSDGEMNYLKACLKVIPKDKIGSIVIDSYDTYNFMNNIAGDPEIVNLIKERADHGGKIVFRPDSGDPSIVTLRILDILARSYGYSYNDAGYKVLHPSVSVIWGDGLTAESIISLYESLTVNRWAASNLVIGFGGGLLQKVNRDDQRFAIKASFAEKTIIEHYGDEMDNITTHINLQKNPGTDPTKKSKTGKLKLTPTGNNSSFTTVSSVGETSAQFNSYADCLETVFHNGELIRSYTFRDIRSRVEFYG